MSVFKSATRSGVGFGEEPDNGPSLSDTIAERVMKGMNAICAIALIAAMRWPRGQATAGRPRRAVKNREFAFDPMHGPSPLAPLRHADA